MGIINLLKSKLTGEVKEEVKVKDKIKDLSVWDRQKTQAQRDEDKLKAEKE